MKPESQKKQEPENMADGRVVTESQEQHTSPERPEQRESENPLVASMNSQKSNSNIKTLDFYGRY